MSIMKNFITTQNWSRSELQDILDFAIELKNKPHQPLLKNKSIAMLFFNPSLRTKTALKLELVSFRVPQSSYNQVKMLGQLNLKKILSWMETQKSM